MVSGMATVIVHSPCQASKSPTPPTSMMPISHALMMRMITALSRMSASWPDSAERMKNGRMNSAVASEENQPSAAGSLSTL
jgi:hypothetical protein